MTTRIPTWCIIAVAVATILPILADAQALQGTPDQPLTDAAVSVAGPPDRPAWMTDELEQRLRNGETVPIDDIEGFPYSAEEHQQAQDCNPACPALPYTHIRPGAALGIPQRACTANFVFQNETSLAIGTAGHCMRSSEIFSTLLVNADHEIGLVPIGETMYRSRGVGNDFGLIELDASVHHVVEPAVSVIDGPCGWGWSEFGAPVQMYGHGVGWGAGGQPRTGTVLDPSDAYFNDAVYHTIAPGASGGDSGSPVIDAVTGQAIAVHTHGWVIPAGPLAIGTSLPRVFELLEDDGLGDWTLVDSPNCLGI